MISRKEIFSIPNIIGYIRILLIPVFMYIYIEATQPRDYYIAAIVVLVSSFSDLFDGLIARKFDMVTELGKFIDPLADKLTHGALIICLLTRFKLMWMLLAIYILKEGFMSVAGLLLLKKKDKKLDGAKWFGKVCTAVLFLSMFALFLLPELDIKIANAIMITCAAVMIATLILYIPVFIDLSREE